MIIVAASDLHAYSGNISRTRAIADAMCDSGADALVLAGDLTSGSASRYHKVLGLFERFPGPKLFVPGNHDIWRQDPQPEDTWRWYEKQLPRIVTECGFHALDQGPLIVGEVAFIGCLGWYDYSLRQLTPPTDGLHMTPTKPTRGSNGNPRLLAGGEGRAGVAW